MESSLRIHTRILFFIPFLPNGSGDGRLSVCCSLGKKEIARWRTRRLSRLVVLYSVSEGILDLGWGNGKVRVEVSRHGVLGA